MLKKLNTIYDYLMNAGGAVQFHYVNDICLSAENGEVKEVVLTSVTEDNPFGIDHVPFKDKTLIDRIIKEIKK